MTETQTASGNWLCCEEVHGNDAVRVFWACLFGADMGMQGGPGRLFGTQGLC